MGFEGFVAQASVGAAVQATGLMALMDLAVGSTCLFLSPITMCAVHLKTDHILKCGLEGRVH